MLTIPLQAEPSQIVNVVLANQPCTIDVYQKDTGLFLDLYVNSGLIIGGVACRYWTRMVRNIYLGFAGDLAWLDTQGVPGSQVNPPLDPTYDGIGSRYFLMYLTAAEARDT